MARHIGLDFGTTNSALAVADDHGDVTLARFDGAAGPSDTFRSVLFFHPELRGPGGRLRPVAGSEAIERYLVADGAGRLIQSIKTWLADRTLLHTRIFEQSFRFEDLLAELVRILVSRAEAVVGPLGRSIVVGRPVRFVGAGDDDADDDWALGRLRTAIVAAGFDVRFELEPVAAARFYELGLDHDEVVLVADFGGGTSDFSLLEVGPTARRSRERTVLATGGLGVAGDVLDAAVLDRIVAPALGAGTRYTSIFSTELDVPVWLYAKLRRWHHLSFLKAPRTLAFLDELADRSHEPRKLQALRHIIDCDLGYHLYRAVERTKVALSDAPSAPFSFHDEALVTRKRNDPGGVDIDAVVERDAFEAWIADDLGRMGACVDDVLARACAAVGDVDRVFLTGGTSLVPGVRRLFESRFGAERIRSGGELVSVASGLALAARS